MRRASKATNDPTEYGEWVKSIYYEGVCFVRSHQAALRLAEQCRRLNARCQVLQRQGRSVLAMPGDAPADAVEYAERMAS